MHEQFLRTEMVLGQPALERLQSAHVAVFGLGGVGSYAVEILARSGVGELTLVDQDTVSVTNINRQLCALHSTVGQSKAEVTARRCRDISPSAVIHPICATYDAAHREDFFSARYDYIADCIDLVTCKLDLIQQAMDRRHPHPVGAGDRQQAGPHPAAGNGYLSDQRLPAGPCHAEGTAQPWHPPPEGGVQPGAARRHYPAGGPLPRSPQRPGQCAMGPLHRRYPAGRHHCAGPHRMRGGDIAGLLIRQARLQRDWSQEGLCRGICAPSYLSKIEQGKAAPSPEVTELLLHRLGLVWTPEPEG